LLRNCSGVYQVFQLQLFLPELLSQSVLLGADSAYPVENTIVDASQANGENQNQRETENNKNEMKSESHNQSS
jgi:hypothetical protein